MCQSRALKGERKYGERKSAGCSFAFIFPFAPALFLRPIYILFICYAFWSIDEFNG